MSRLALAAVTFTLLLASLAVPATAHEAPSYGGWERQLHDCNDDWGPHDGDQAQSGHDLVALDAREGTVPSDGRVGVALRLTMADGFAPDDNGTLTESITFTRNNETVTTNVSTTDNENFTHAGGVAPMAIVGPSNTNTANQFTLDLWFTHNALGVNNTMTLTDFEVQGWFNLTQEDEAQGDHMVGDDSDAALTGSDGCAVTDNIGFSGDGFEIDQDPGQPPVAAFSRTPNEPATGQQVTFTDESSDPDSELASWSWDFGDGDTADSRNATHAFGAAGTYNVTLTVTDDNGNTANVTHAVTVVGAPPSAGFSVDPAEPEVGQTVTFRDTSNDPDGDLESWSWDLGDGNTTTGDEITHAYERPGSYNVTLTVTDGEGNTDTHSRELAVALDQGEDDEDAGDENETAEDVEVSVSAKATPSNTTAGKAVTFSAEVDVAGDNATNLTYEWTFGDGASGQGAVISHTYTEAGTYEVELVVTHQSGATGNATTTVGIAQGATETQDNTTAEANTSDEGDEELDQAATNDTGSDNNTTETNESDGGSGVPAVGPVATLVAALAVATLRRRGRV